MSESSTTLHEPAERLTPDVVDRHRAIVSLMEELEAAVPLRYETTKRAKR